MEKLQIEMSEIEIRNRKVFRVLFDTFFPRACFFCERLLNDREAGADVAQDVFLYLWQQEKCFPNLLAFKTYLYIVLKARCLNVIRSQTKRIDVAELREMPSNDLEIDHLIIKQELQGQIVSEINKLPAIKREIMLMRLEGKSYETISEELGLALNTVKTYKKDSYKQLRLGLSKGEQLAMTWMILWAYWIG